MKSIFKKQLLGMVVGNFIFAASQWAIVILIAKLGSVQMVGQFSLGQAWTAPLFLLLNFQLRVVLMTDSQQKHQFQHLIQLRMLTTCLAIVLFTIIAWINGYRTQTLEIICIVGLSKAFESLSDVIYGHMQKMGRMELVSRSIILRGTLSVIMLYVLLSLTGNLIIGLLGIAVVWLSVLLLHDLRYVGSFTKLFYLFNFKDLVPILKLCYPLGIVTMLLSLNENMPRYFIEHILGTQALGYFAAILYFKFIGTILVNAIGQSFSTKLAHTYSSGNKQGFISLVLKLVSIGCIVGILGYLIVLYLGNTLLAILYQQNYEQFHHFALLIMIGAGLEYMSSFFGYAMTAAQYFKIQPFLFATSMLTNATFCYIFIPKFGLEGAAYALMVSSLIQLIGNGCINFIVIRKCPIAQIAKGEK